MMSKYKVLPLTSQTAWASCLINPSHAISHFDASSWMSIYQSSIDLLIQAREWHTVYNFVEKSDDSNEALT